jgi:hypothetical protein
MRCVSFKHVLPPTFALVALAIASGCEEDTPYDGRASAVDASFDTSARPAGDASRPSLEDGGVDDAAADADAGPVDAGSAVVVMTRPLDGRVGVGTATKVTVTFGTAMQAATVTAQAASGACTGSFQLLEGPEFTSCVGGTITTTDGVAFTFTPAGSLGTELRYQVRVSAAALAADGRPMTAYAMTTGFMTQKFPVDAKVLYMAGGSMGNLGGIAGADNACATKPTRPVGVVAAKAMITAATRRACSVSNCGDGNTQLDWVLRPNQHYVRQDGKYVFLTDANGIFTAYPAENDLGTGINFWDGLNPDWTSRGPTCTDWTSTADVGAVGFDVGLTNQWLAGGQLACSLARPYVCAEQ